ncbi:MAG: HNH endonuclease [Bacteroidota bacterium]
MPHTPWSRQELILALNLYLKLPFGQMHQGNPEIKHLARVIGRTPGAVAMRLTNFASVDPYHQRRGVKGLTGGKKQVQPIWDEFINNKEELLFESEKILAEMENHSVESKYASILSGTEHLTGKTKVREVQTRVNQYVFRQMVLANYSGRCAITGIDIPELLVAGHIVPWSENKKERLNPANGICLSALYDRAFDKGLIGLNQNYEILLSGELKKNREKDYYDRYFAPMSGKKISLPEKYHPVKEFLEYHREVVFRG